MSAGTDRRSMDHGERALRVEAGRVVCPRRGLVDIVVCWMCPSYRGLTSGRVEALICGLSDDSLASAFWALDHAPGSER